MNNKRPTALPSPEGTASTSKNKPENSESDIEIQKLLSEIRLLSESGRDPARLWNLKQTRDKHYLQEINKALALFPKPDQSGWPEFQEMEQARLQSHQVAIARTDLTVPEALLLYQSNTEAVEQHRQFLLAQKETLERRLHLGKRRNGLRR